MKITLDVDEWFPVMTFRKWEEGHGDRYELDVDEETSERWNHALASFKRSQAEIREMVKAGPICFGWWDR